MNAPTRPLLRKWLTMKAIAEMRGLGGPAKVAAFVLLDHMNFETGQCNPSLPTIAEEMGVSRSNAAAAVRCLVEANVFTKAQRGAGSRVDYELAPQSDWRQPIRTVLTSGRDPSRNQDNDSPEIRIEPVLKSGPEHTYEHVHGYHPRNGASARPTSDAHLRDADGDLVDF